MERERNGGIKIEEEKRIEHKRQEKSEGRCVERKGKGIIAGISSRHYRIQKMAQKKVHRNTNKEEKIKELENDFTKIQKQRILSQKFNQTKKH